MHVSWAWYTYQYIHQTEAEYSDFYHDRSRCSLWLHANNSLDQLLLSMQGCITSNTVLYQDNKSAILTEKNGNMSSSKRKKHIKTRFYFITNHIKNEELSIGYCPTVEMVGQLFTKPLQGKLFLKFRRLIMNTKLWVSVSSAILICTSHRRSVLE